MFNLAKQKIRRDLNVSANVLWEENKYYLYEKKVSAIYE